MVLSLRSKIHEAVGSIATGRRFETGYIHAILGIHCRFRKRLIGLPDTHACRYTTGTSKNLGTDLFEEVLGHVFSSRVVRHDEQSTWLDHPQRLDRIIILMRDQETVVPMLIEPPLAPGFQLGKIHHPADSVLRIAGDKKIADVVVPVEVLALASVLVKSVPRTKLDAAHDRQTHRVVPMVGYGTLESP